MKFYIQVISILAISFLNEQKLIAQSTNTKNYVSVTNVKQSGIKDEASLSIVPIAYDGKSQVVNYVDGLGRSLQSVNIKASPNLKDIVSPVEYDILGRESKKYLPYTDNSSVTFGSFKTDWATKQPAFYNGALQGVDLDAMAFSQTVFEISPLNRPLAQGAQGSAWQPNVSNAYDATKKVSKIKYEVNLASENIVIWNVANTTANFDITQITRSGYYADGLLSLKHTWDENGNEQKEYTDKEGKIIVKKFQDGASTWAQTYYIYDDFGRLRAVIQPEGVNALPATLDNTFAGKWMFLYRYDERGRMVMKKIPGADSVVMVYDQWDRMVLTQDGVQRAKTNKEWLFTKYDVLNRPVMTGIYVNNGTHGAIRTLVSTSTVRFENINSSVTEGYTLNSAFPTTYQELLTVTHYDNYNNLPSWKTDYPFVAENGNASSNTFITGLPIASQTKVLGTSTWLRVVTYYDDKGRMIESNGDNIKSGIDRSSIKVMWDGKPTEQWQSHTSTFYSIAIVVKKKFSYDHADRVLTVKHQINSQEEVTIATNAYNDLGQLLNKKLHISSSYPTQLQKLDYGYNIRGWLNNINRVENSAGVTTFEANDLFAFELGYNTSILPGSTTQSNGNISEQRWKGPFAETPIGFGYAYDKLNRLLSATSSDKSGTSWSLNNKYDEKNITYDKNGNIKTLARYDNGVAIDNLTFSNHDGNKLQKVEDAGDATLGFKNAVNTATEYLYDQNGSLTKDDNKAISSIVYNYLNLPATVNVTSKGNVNYLYDASGRKLKKTTFDQTTNTTSSTWYCGDFVYKEDVPELLSHEEGRIRPVKINAALAATADNFKYVYDYFLKDHLGNVRMVITPETQTTIYAATMEVANATVENQLFSNINSTIDNKPAGFDAISGNAKVSRLNGNISTAGNYRTGPAIVLKVMAGDIISVSTQAWYSGTVQPPVSGVTPIITELADALTNGIMGAGGGKGGVFSGSYVDGLSENIVNTFLTNQSYVNTRPKAYLNWIIVDEQFGVVNSSGHVGAIQVPTISAGSQKQQITGPVNLQVQKSGFIYVYVSNESNMNVYFDDLVINHKTGPVLEVTNYYPFGKEISSLSSKAAGGQAENKYKFNGKEFQKDLDLEWLDYGARMYDNNLGKWMVVDPLAEKSRRWSTYNYCYNNPLTFTDPDGMEAEDSKKYDDPLYRACFMNRTVDTYVDDEGKEVNPSSPQANNQSSTGTFQKNNDKSQKPVLPTYSELESNYPSNPDGTDIEADVVAADVGGMVNALYTDNGYTNACALRLSKALNYSGVKIPKIKNETFKGADGKYYFLGAEKMLIWMKKTFGAPDIEITGASDGSQLLGNKGLYFMLPKDQSKFGASGHATKYNGTECPGGPEHCYFDNAPADGGVRKAFLWKLK